MDIMLIINNLKNRINLNKNVHKMVINMIYNNRIQLLLIDNKEYTITYNEFMQLLCKFRSLNYKIKLPYFWTYRNVIKASVIYKYS